MQTVPFNHSSKAGFAVRLVGYLGLGLAVPLVGCAWQLYVSWDARARAHTHTRAYRSAHVGIARSVRGLDLTQLQVSVEACLIVPTFVQPARPFLPPFVPPFDIHEA